MTEIDITSDDTMTLTEACRILPRGRNGAKPHISTLVRWITDGAPATDGRRVRLSAVRVGGKWITSRAALREFSALLTPHLEPDMPPPLTPSKRRREEEERGKRLEKVGI